jgi:hypothetical protein
MNFHRSIVIPNTKFSIIFPHLDRVPVRLPVLMPGAVLVQIQYNSMETIDTVDISWSACR